MLLILLEACVLLNPDRPRNKPKTLKIETPPGTVWLRDQLFIDQREISNYDYLEFLAWLSRKDKKKYLQMLPDTLVWRDTSFFNEPFVQHYLRHNSFAAYPIVGVSLEQAQSWRSYRVNEMMFLRQYKVKYDSNIVYGFLNKVRYRLPTREEWEFAAQAGLNIATFPYGYNEVKFHGSVVDNIAVLSNEQALYFPGHVYGSRKNAYAVQGLLGNVSELTSDSMVKGLNFLTFLNGASEVPDIRYIHEPDTISVGYAVKSYMKYEKPASWLGFRCVCEVLK